MRFNPQTQNQGRALSSSGMKILFVAEQFIPPVFDGSSAVYESVLRSLREIGDVYPIFFMMYRAPTEETHSYLRRMCGDYLILPWRGRSAALKMARTFGRLINGSLFAHPLIEEFGRRSVKTAISQFIARNEPDIALISKLECVYLLGREILTGLRIPKLLDLHDDFVMREKLERQVLRHMLAEFPALASDQYFRLLRLRHRMSRLNVERGRRQETWLLDLFDRILISSREEYLSYSVREGLADKCVHMPWPIEIAAKHVERSNAPEFDAGLIATGNAFNIEGLAFLVKEVMPLIRKRRPGFRLLLAGNIVDPFLNHDIPLDGMVMAGAVKDLSEFYSRIKVCLVPLRNGAGVSLKTLEALSYGLPVVATRKGARGLGDQTMPNLHLADTAEAFAETTLSLLEDWPNGASDAPASVSNRSPEDYLRRFVQLCADLGVESLPLNELAVAPARQF